MSSLAEIFDSLHECSENINSLLDQLKTEVMGGKNAVEIKLSGKMIEIPISRKTGKVLSDGSEYNPARQAAGSVNGVKAAGIPKTKTVRRSRGTVNVKNMTPDEKREYWRWAKARQTERRAGEISHGSNA